MRDDVNLVDSCLSGKDSAWLQIQKLVESILAEVGYAPPSPVFDRSDVVQETLLVLIRQDMRALKAFKGHSSIRAYLRTIVKRVVAKISGREREAPIGPPLDPAEEQVADTPVDVSVDYVLVHDLIQALLSPMDQRILYLDSLGYTSDEIADILTRIEERPISSPQVRQRKSRAIRRLRRVLSHF